MYLYDLSHPSTAFTLPSRHIWSRRSQDTRALLSLSHRPRPTRHHSHYPPALHCTSHSPPYSYAPWVGAPFTHARRSHETSSSPPPAAWPLSHLGTHVDLNAARNLRHTHCFNISNLNRESYSLLRSSRLVALLSCSPFPVHSPPGFAFTLATPLSFIVPFFPPFVRAHAFCSLLFYLSFSLL